MILERNLPVDLINLTPIQKQYYRDTHRFIVVSAGRRSRKTLIGKRKILNYALENPGVRLFHGAPTRAQAKAIFWEQLKRETKEFRAYYSDTDLKVVLNNGSEIVVIGLDKPERIEGQPWHGGHITETGNLKPQALDENIRPVLSDTNGFLILDGVPEGRNWYYDTALYASGGVIPPTAPMAGAYAENPNDKEWVFYSWFSSDVLPEAEIVSVKGKLDERTYRQEYEGSFEGSEGLAYYAFGPHNLKMVERNPSWAVHVGMDFNVDPMTATLGHIVSDQYHQFGEVYLRNSNTYEMVRHLLEVEKLDPGNTFIYPDSTGKARESNAQASDLAILRKDGGFLVKAKPSNPPVRARLNSSNSLMKSYSGEVRYFVNPQTCPKTVNDLNKVEVLPDGRENKEQEKQGLVHISSALGYLIHFNFPVTSGTFANV